MIRINFTGIMTKTISIAFIALFLAMGEGSDVVDLRCSCVEFDLV